MIITLIKNHIQPGITGITAERDEALTTTDDEATALVDEFLTWDDVAGSVADAVLCAM